MGVESFKAAQGADERAGRAFRAQAKVHAEQRALRRQARDLGDHAFGQTREEQMAGHARAGLFARARARLEKTPLLAVKKHNVHVGTVIQFLPAQLAEAQHAEAGGLPAAVGGGMERLAQAPRQRVQAKAEDRVQTHIGDIGYFAGDFQRPAQAGQIARGDAEHFALFEFAQLGKGEMEIVVCQGGLEPLLDFAAQALLAPGMLDQAGFQKRQPFGMRGEQFARPLRAGQQRGQNARLLRGRPPRNPGGPDFQQAGQGRARPQRVGACLNGFGERLRLHGCSVSSRANTATGAAEAWIGNSNLKQPPFRYSCAILTLNRRRR